MKFLLLLGLSFAFSSAQAKYLPPPISSTYHKYMEINQRVQDIFADKVTDEPNQKLFYYAFVDIKTYLCIKERTILNDTDLDIFVRELHKHHPFSSLQFEAVAGNIYRMYSGNVCTSQDEDILYAYLKQNNLYVSTEMPVIGIGSTQATDPYKLFDLAKVEEKKLENFNLSIKIVETEDVWKGRSVFKYRENFLEISKSGKLLQTLTVPSIFDYNIPQVSHTGVGEEIKSIQLFKYLRKLALVVYNTENVVSVWTTDIERLNEWKLVGVADPALLLDAKLDEATNGYANDFTASFTMTTSELAVDRNNNVYIISTGMEGIYRSGAWKAHRIDNF